MIEMGLVKEAWGLSLRDEGARAWDTLTEKQKKQLDYRMAVYAAQIYAVDTNVGKLVQSLKDLKKWDNTLILFLSDNGGCAEPYKDLGGGAFKSINDPNLGGAISYGQGWANASNTPYRLFKVRVHEGGISTPLIAHWPDVIQDVKGRLCHDPAYLIDVMPSVLEVTGASYPATYQGHTIHPLEGRSLMPAWQGKPLSKYEWMFWEHMNNCAIRHGEWKAIQKRGKGGWELYNLGQDRCELNDLASMQPEILQKLTTQWETWAREKYVLPKGK